MIKEIQIKKYKKPKPRILIHLLVLLAGISIVYFKAAKAPFVLDDIHKIVLNDDIKEGISPSKLLFQYKKRPDKIGHDLPSPDWDRNDPSRPLTYLSYTINYSLSGLKYISWHVFDFFLHFFIVLLIYFFLKKLTSLYLSPPPKILYFLPALIFAIHPAGTNTVSYAFARAGHL
ncbi:MAG: hypothetical protein GX817_04090, partial [Elusimicrobia bacterium]|nr:hypothetical protein [Elusimicrobiota bacterium]